MSHLVELFQKREEVFDDFTSVLREELYNVMAAVGNLMGPDVQGNLSWGNVLFVDDTVILTAAVQFPIGYELPTEDGQIITVNEELQKQLSQLIRVGVPLALAEDGTQEEITDYLEQLDLKKEDAARVHEAENPLIETVADIAGEFRSDGLTQEQIADMIMYAEQSKGKVN